jgi:hypothetical protein
MQQQLQRENVRSVLEEVFDEEEDVGGAFGKAAHDVGVPLRAEGDVDADTVALGGELALEVAADAVEHLELEARLSILWSLTKSRIWSTMASSWVAMPQKTPWPFFELV